MKSKIQYTCLALIAVLIFASACSKNANQTSFTANINSKSYSYDSTLASLDYRSASFNYYYLNILAKDTKQNNVIAITAYSVGSDNFMGNYFNAPPSSDPLPSSYKVLSGTGVLLSFPTSKYYQSQTRPSTLSITKVTTNSVQGNFTIFVNPTLPNGAPDESQNLELNGQFNMPAQSFR